MDDQNSKPARGPYVSVLDTDNQEVRIVSGPMSGPVMARIPAPPDPNDKSRILDEAAQNASLIRASWEMRETLRSMLVEHDKPMNPQLAESAGNLLDYVDNRGPEGLQLLKHLQWLEEEATPEERRQASRSMREKMEVNEDLEEEEGPDLWMVKGDDP